MVNEFPLQTSFLKDKSVFLTGGTGFVGKAILELLVRDHYPHIDTIFCLVRGRKGQTVQDRLINDVLTNKLFNVVRDRLGPLRFRELVESKMVAIEGDISLPGLGISAADREVLRKKLNVVIHCAATVDFNERLDRSLTLNTLGTMQILDLCDECEAMDGFVHVSTAYVNSNRNESVIHERVYPMVFGDPTELVGRIKGMDLPAIEEFTKEILTVYPNTYTFTKSLAENMVVERAESMRMREMTTGRAAWSLSIVRPTVVTSTAVDPVPGWVDGVSAANGIAMYIGLGVMDSIPGPKESVLDLVPVDYLANVVIRACAAFHPPGINFTLALADPSRKVRTLEQELPIDPNEEVYPTIYHAASSAINPVSWNDFGNGVVSSWNKLPPLKKQVFPPAFHKYSTDAEYSAMLHLKQQFKFSTVAMLISLSDPKRGEKLRGQKKKLNFLYHCFTHFMTRAWAFQATAVYRVEERQRGSRSILTSRFGTGGLKSMPWSMYIDFFIYGMYYFVLNESNLIRPPILAEGWECVLHQRPSLVCNDEPEYVTPTNPWVVANAHELRSGFIHDSAVQACLGNVNEDIARAKQALIRELVRGERLLGGLDKANQLQTWLASGIESIHVNRSKILKLRDMVRLRPNARVIYLPTHHSNLDFALLCHVLERYSLPSPLVAAEGNCNLKGYSANHDTITSHSLFSSILASPATKATLVRQYLVRLIQAKGSAALFLDCPPHIASLNDSPTATGPVSSLERGEVFSTTSGDLLSSLVSAIRQPDSGISPGDVILVPLAISHETGLDMRHVTSQWGEEVTTTQRIARITGDACKGRIHVAFGNAMELGGLIGQVDQIRQLGMDDPSLTNPSYLIRSRQIQCQIVSPVALTAMILSRYRITGISFDYCRTLLTKLRDEALGLGYNIDWQAGEDSSAILSYCLETIGPNHVAIEMGEDEEDFSGPTPAQVRRILLKKDEPTAMRLRALVGQAQHMFLFEGLFMAAYCHCNEQAAATGMGLPTLEDIRIIYAYLATLMAPHHPEINVLSSQNDFKAIVARLEKDDIVQLMDTDQAALVILNNDRLHQDYLYTAQALLYPTLNSYWATCCALALLPSLHDIQASKFVSLIQENIREACAKSIGCHPEAAAAPTIYNALSCFSQLGLINIHTPSEDGDQEPRLSVSTQRQAEHEGLKNYLATWCPVPTAQGGHHIDQFLGKGSDAQHRAFLECVEQVGFSIELFRSESPGQPAMMGPSLKQDDLLPQLLPPTPNSPEFSPRSDSRFHSLPATNLSSSLILGWGHYLQSFLTSPQASGAYEKLPSPGMEFFNHIQPNASRHSRDNSRT